MNLHTVIPLGLTRGSFEVLVFALSCLYWCSAAPRILYCLLDAHGITAFFRSLPDFISHAFITSGFDERQFGEKLLKRYSVRLGELNIRVRP